MRVPRPRRIQGHTRMWTQKNRRKEASRKACRGRVKGEG